MSKRDREDEAFLAAIREQDEPTPDALLRRVTEKVGEISVSVALDTGNVFVRWWVYGESWRQIKAPTLAAALQAVLDEEDERGDEEEK